MALLSFGKVSQPLVQFLDPQVYQDLMKYLSTGRNYRSLLGLQAQPETVMAEKIG